MFWHEGGDIGVHSKIIAFECIYKISTFQYCFQSDYDKMHRTGPLSRNLLLTLSCILALCGLEPRAVAERGANGREREEQIMRNAKAAEVLKYMNLNADPCNDFYDFACGNWMLHQPKLLEGDAPISVQSQLVQRVRMDVQMLLDAGARSKGRPNLDERKVKEFYKSCLVVERSSALQQAFLMNFIKEYHGLPLLAGTNWNMNYDWVQVVARLRLNYGFDYLIGMEVESNEHSLPGKAVIRLTEPATSLLPRHLCSAGATVDAKDSEELTAQLQTEIARDLQSWFGLKEDETERVAGDIIRFEFELCRYMREEESLPPSEDDETEPNVYEGRDLVRLSKQFGNIINFRRFLETSLNSTVANSEIVMKSQRYFKHLTHIARVYPRPTLTNYIMYRALAEINFPRNETSNPRGAYCAQLVMRYFPKVVGEIYKNKYQRSEIRGDAEQLFADIKGTLSESLNVNDLSDNAQKVLRNKLLAYETLLFPIYKGVNLRDLPLEHTNFWHKQNIAMMFKGYKERQRFYGGDPELDENIVEAFDVRMKLLDNGVMTGWGLLQPPFYEYNYSNSLKYALLGPLIARELAGALIPDEQETELTRDESIMEIFSNITECYRMQYSNYLYNIPNVFYNASKLLELMTDSAGLNVAFKAYLGWLASVDPSNRPILLRETLPGVDFTNTQLFFIIFAQSRCHAKYIKETPPTFLPLDTHTEELFNINGVLANNVEFAREFGCTLGTDMNPDDKCTMF